MHQAEVFKDHRIAELFGVEDTNVLTDREALRIKAHSLAERLKLTVVAELPHDFPPKNGEIEGGQTLVLVVAESHLAFHTWEREKYIHIDGFTCSPHTRMRNFRKHVMAEFPAEKTKTKKIRY